MGCRWIVPPNWWIAAYTTLVPTRADVASCVDVTLDASRPERCRILPVPASSRRRLSVFGLNPSHFGRPCCAKFSSTASSISAAISDVIGDASCISACTRAIAASYFVSSTWISIIGYTLSIPIAVAQAPD
ncbi:hypothetical protein X942_5472 [Burkholderia pseudomallei MSHR5596]|nr:hypothetical protein X942_5472 [Burkholderia pseudomallei MSHR5596]